MKAMRVNIRLAIVFGILLIGFFLSKLDRNQEENLVYAPVMKEAASLSQSWMDIIKNEKTKREIASDSKSNVPNSFMIGNDFSLITTTLGSLESKEISSNPDFAALVVRFLYECGLGEDAKVGVIASGSFPSLTISTLAALQVMNTRVFLLSSLGASSFGANQEDATWIDMENWLLESGQMNYSSQIVSRGAENDNGEGLMEEGIAVIDQASARNHAQVYIPLNLSASIEYKLNYLLEKDIDLLINIGGNQSALGRCSHSSSLPNGMHEKLHLCQHAERGIIQEISATGKPVIHLLNIMDLAMEYGIDPSPGRSYAESRMLYSTVESSALSKIIILITLILSIALLWPLGNEHRRIRF